MLFPYDVTYTYLCLLFILNNVYKLQNATNNVELQLKYKYESEERIVRGCTLLFVLCLVVLVVSDAAVAVFENSTKISTILLY